MLVIPAKVNVMDDYFDMQENIKNISQKANAIKPKKKLKLNKKGKLLLYGSIVTLITSSTLKIVGDVQQENFQKENQLDSTLSISKQIIDRDTLVVSKSALDNIYSHNFDVNALFTELEPAIEIYNKYKHHASITPEQNKEKEKAYDTILSNNDKIIEVFNEVVKCHISKQLLVPTEFIDIKFISTDDSHDGTVTVTVYNKNALISEEFADLIRSYKSGLLTTYDVKKPLVTDFIRDEKVEKIIENMRNFRSVLAELNNNPEKYTVLIQTFDKVSENDIANYKTTLSVNEDER